MVQQKITRLNHENPKLSYKFGFLGIGMGGTSIAAACADIQTNITNNRFPYNAVLINSNQIDLEKVNPRNTNIAKVLIGNGKGAGRNIEIGESLYKSEIDKIESAINTQFKDSEFIWLTVGLGGGTGTGSVIQAIGSLMKNNFNKKFGLILTLPRNEEGRTVINNALQRLQLIYGAMNNLGPILLVDNQKLFKEFSESNPNSTIADYLKYSNSYVAEALHDLNTVTASYVPVGENHFDSSEFGFMLRTSGLIHFARFNAKSSDIDVAQSVSYSDKIKEEIQNGVISDGYNLATAKRAALSVLANKNDSKRLFTLEFSHQLEQMVASVAQSASEKPVALYTYETTKRNNNDVDNNVYFYAVFAGLGLPEARIAELVEADREAAEAEKLNSVTVNKDLFGGFVASSNANPVEEVAFEDLFKVNEDKGKVEELDNDALLKSLGLK